MEGLLPIASSERNGLLNKNDVSSIGKSSNINGAGKFLKITSIHPVSWTRTMIEIVFSPTLTNGICVIYLYMGSDSEKKQGVIGIKMGNGGICEIYKDNDYIYVKNLYIYSSVVFARILGGSYNGNQLIMEEIESIPSDATLII